MGDIVVGDGHPLGHPGGARGVNQVGDILWRRAGQRRAGLALDGGVVDIDDRQIVPVEPVGQLGGGECGDRGGISEQEPDPRRRQPRIDRHIRRPGLKHRQDRDDRLRRARHQQPHTLTRARPLAGQQVRQPVSGLAPARDRSSSRPHKSAPPPPGMRHLGGKQCRNRHPRPGGPGQHRPVADHIQAGMLTARRAHQSRPPAGPDQSVMASSTRSSRPISALDAGRCRTPRCRIRCEDPVHRPAGPPPSAGSGWIRGR